MDYTFNTPSDPLRSVDCVKQRCNMIAKNMELLGKKFLMYKMRNVDLQHSSKFLKYN
jgi:hypothetical protein